MIDRLYRVSVSYACFGFICRDGKVVETAPIGKWMRGKAEAYCVTYWRRKGECERVRSAA